MSRPRPAQWPSILAGVVIVVAGVGAALVEAYRVSLGLPRGSVWILAAATAVILVALRAVSRRARRRADRPEGRTR